MLPLLSFLWLILLKISCVECCKWQGQYHDNTAFPFFRRLSQNQFAKPTSSATAMVQSALPIDWTTAHFTHCNHPIQTLFKKIITCWRRNDQRYLTLAKKKYRNRLTGFYILVMLEKLFKQSYQSKMLSRQRKPLQCYGHSWILILEWTDPMNKGKKTKESWKISQQTKQAESRISADHRKKRQRNTETESQKIFFLNFHTMITANSWLNLTINTRAHSK